MSVETWTVVLSLKNLIVLDTLANEELEEAVAMMDHPSTSVRHLTLYGVNILAIMPQFPQLTEFSVFMCWQTGGEVLDWLLENGFSDRLEYFCFDHWGFDKNNNNNYHHKTKN